MSKIVDYRTVIADSEQELVRLVKENIDDWGWPRQSARAESD